jgi:hypothetical protein
MTELNFELNEDEIEIYKDCKWILAESFDSSFYVDVNELKMKKYEQMYTFYLSNKVNTETAEYNSRNFKLFIYINNNIINCQELSQKSKIKKCKILIKLPIHLRYHAPNTSPDQKSNDYVEISLNKPKVFVNNCSAHLNQNIALDFTKTHSSQSFYTEYTDFEDLNYNYSNMTINLPCDKNISVPNDYLIYISNFNKKSGELQYQLNKIQIDFMNFNEKICKFAELTFKEVCF